MSSALVTPPRSGAPASAAPKLTAGEQLIAARIAEAQAALWRAELLRLVLKLVIAGLAALLLWAVVDHWIWSPGRLVRTLVLAGGVAAALGWIATRILPLLRGRIRAEYAAQSLEQDLPQLRHALTSYVALRDDVAAEGPRGAVVRSIGARAAGQIKQHQVDVPSEAAGTFTWWIALAATLAVTAAYALVSPKNTLQSTQRLLLPLAGIEAPTRVAIVDVQPGDSEVLADRPLAISAQISGLAQRDEPAVQYGADFRQRAAMQLDPASGRFVADVRVSRSTPYRIAAGDAVTATFHISARAVPVASVRSVQVAPPRYTGLAQRQSAGGAITAEENSAVTVTATTNRPIERASVEFNPRQTAARSGPVAGSVPMEVAADGLTATATFPVRLPRGAATAVPLDSYRIRVWDADGNENPDPIVYPVRIIPDLPPEVAIAVPREVVKEVPLHSQQLFEITALDPDYGLQQIELIMQRGVDPPTTEIIWSSAPAAHGNQIVEYRFRPQALGLRVGDKVSVVAAAVDNRQEFDEQPARNRSETQPIELVIVAPQQIPPASTPEDGLSEPDDEPANPAAPNDQPPAGDSGDANGSEGTPGGGSAAAGKEDGGGEQQPSGAAGAGDQPDHSTDSAAGNDPQPGSEAAENAADSAEGAQAGQGARGGQAGQSSQTPQGEQEAMSGQDAQDGAESPSQPSAAAEPGNTGQQDRTDPQNSADSQPGMSEQDTAGAPADGDAAAEGNAAAEGSPAEQRRGEQAAGGADPAGGESSAGNDNTSGSKASPAGESTETPSPNSEGSPADNGQAADPTAAPSEATGADRGATSGASEDAANEPTAPPEHDGDAFERIRDYLEQQREKSSQPRPAPSESPDPSQGQPGSAEGTDAAGDSADSPTDGDSAGASETPDPSSTGQEATGQEPAEPPPAGQPQAEQQSPTADEPGAASGAMPENQSGAAAGDQEAGDAAANAPRGDDAGSSKSDAGTAAGDPEATARDAAAGRPADSADSAGEPGEGAEPAEGSGDASDQAGGSETASPSSGDTSGDSSATSGAPQPGDAGFGAEGVGESGNHDGRPPDPVDLEHARQATDLVLDYLDQNRETPDPELLERLNWTPKELRAFSERWRELLRSQDPAGGGDPHQVEEALRSLGLRQRPEGPIGQRRGQDDAMRGLRDSGNRPPAPTLYRDAFEAFRRSVGRP